MLRASIPDQSEKSSTATNPVTVNQLALALLKGPVISTLMRLAAPNIILAFMQGIVSFTDTWFIGQIGTEGLAAIALVFPLAMLMQMMSAGAIGGGVSSSIARSLGAGNTAKAEALAAHAVLIAGAFGLLFTGVMILAGPGLYRVLGGKGSVLTQAIAYSSIVFGGALTVWFCNILANIMRGTGNMMIPAIVLCVTASVQIPLCGALVLGWWFFPKLGIIGAGIAYICSYGTAALCFALYIHAGRSGLHIHWRGLKLSMHLFRDILVVGLLSSFNTVQTVATTVIVTGLVASFGTAALAGYGLGVRLEMLQVPIVFAIGSALVPMVGVSFGAANLQRARKIAWVGGALAAFITGSVGIVVALWPHLWAGMFSTDPAVLDSGYTYLRIVGPCYAFLGIGIALYFASQGAGKMMWPMLAGSARFVIAAIGGLIVIHFLNSGLSTLFILIGFAMVFFGFGAAAAVKWRVLR
jgi:putative MATE family efflux protein